MNEMLANFVDKILSLGPIKTQDINGRIYVNRDARLITNPMPNALKTRSLQSIVDYLTSPECINDINPRIIFIESPETVSVQSLLDNENQRELYLFAISKPCNFNFGQWITTEQFIINVQACFEGNEDQEKILTHTGNLVAENIKTATDDGVSQSTIVQKSAASKASAIVPNPVSLKPYRTFREVEQPESQFIFRLRFNEDRKEFHCGLWPADGDAWELTAIDNILGWLQVNTFIQELVSNGRLTMLA